jgi:hypothetical protein
MIENPPLLLTSSATPMDLSGRLNDPALRIKYTLESVGEWLLREPKLRIVICDGSGFDFSDLMKNAFPEANIECLSFINDSTQIGIHGKGFGEGEIIRYAINHSKLLQESEEFMKCTAKLWVANIQQCLSQWSGKFLCNAYFANVFSFKKTKIKFIDTRFYIIRKDIYLQYFLDAHSNLGNISKKSIEDVFLNVILENDMRGILFSTPSIICGVGGGSGKHYKQGVVRIIKDKIRTRIARSSFQYKKLFCR